jgi:hypothetical protein
LGALGGGDDAGVASGGAADVGADAADVSAGAARAGDDAAWGGDSGRVGSVGVSGEGEVDVPSLGGIEGGETGGETGVDIGVVGGEVPGGVADGVRADDGVTDGGVAEADIGERISSFSSSWSRSSSTSFRRRRVFLAGGG